MDLIIFLLLGHYVGDYGLQTDTMATRKKESIYYLTLHVLTYTLTIAGTVVLYGLIEGFTKLPSIPLMGILAAILFITHWAQDYVKSRLSPSRQLYYIDQSLHMLLLVIFRYIILGS
ncbi:MAG: DUF3307 domain-containing protein [candidate division Zixibacteria bacterium]|nr:DUF3307 domain-containing protein [candidate division Zixibacteria bacterium]